MNILWTLFAWMIPVFAFSHTPTVDPGPPSPYLPIHCFPVSSHPVPFQYVNRLIRIEAMVNRSNAGHHFYLDTGAPTFITQNLADLHAVSGSLAGLASDVEGNVQRVQEYLLNSLHLGSWELKNLRVASSEGVAQMPILRGTASGGLLGADAMQGAVWMIDYASQTLYVQHHPEHQCLPENALVSKMYTDRTGSPIIELELQPGIREKFIIDLAFNGSLLVNDKLLSRLDLVDSLRFTRTEKYSTGFRTTYREVVYDFLPSLRIGNGTTGMVKLSSGGKRTKKLIGNEFLEQFILTLDFRNRMVILIPNGREGELEYASPCDISESGSSCTISPG
ncbi:MAG: hypothetical protein KBH75_03380 [Saprospiraceae bacterium]|nr:hypothetical protein [Saprospiraceae bacterium]